MKRELVLTSSMSKRIIAQGVAAHPAVHSAFESGNIGICKGTTTSYVAEEFLGRSVERFSYTTGLTLPKQPVPPIEKPSAPMHDVIIRNGEPHIDGTQVIDAVKNFNPGDVIVKGANALNYLSRTAGCLIGHPAGGTVGGFWGALYGRKLRLVIPVGLEKEIGADIMDVSDTTFEDNPGSTLMPMTGIIVTEIEAIELLTGAHAVQIAAGGIRGAEGAVRLIAEGTDEQIALLDERMAALADEPAF